MSKSFDDLLKQVADCPKKTVAVACAHDDAVLEAVKAAKERGIADAILVGNEAEIKTIARTLKMHINEYKLIQKEIDEQNISIIDYAKMHGIKLGTLYRGLQNAKKYG